MPRHLKERHPGLTGELTQRAAFGKKDRHLFKAVTTSEAKRLAAPALCLPSGLLGRKPGRAMIFLYLVRTSGEKTRTGDDFSASHPDFWGDFPDRKSLSCLSSVFLDTHSQQAQVKIDKLLDPARTDWLEPLAGVYAIDGATITESLAGVYATPWCRHNKRTAVGHICRPWCITTHKIPSVKRILFQPVTRLIWHSETQELHNIW